MSEHRYKVTRKCLVYEECYIMADSRDEALQIAIADDGEWWEEVDSEIQSHLAEECD